MSQPTLSRLENVPDWRTLARIGLGLIDLHYRSFRTPPKHIVLDIDDTDDPGTASRNWRCSTRTTTAPASSRFISSTGSRASRSLLRPGKRPSGEEVAKVLRHVIGRIRKRWPNVAILVRGDSHYCSEPALALLEALGCNYIIGFVIKSKPLQIAAPWRAQCDMRRGSAKPSCAASISCPTGPASGAVRASS